MQKPLSIWEEETIFFTWDVIIAGGGFIAYGVRSKLKTSILRLVF